MEQARDRREQSTESRAGPKQDLPDPGLRFSQEPWGEARVASALPRRIVPGGHLPCLEVLLVATTRDEDAPVHLAGGGQGPCCTRFSTPDGPAQRTLCPEGQPRAEGRHLLRSQNYCAAVLGPRSTQARISLRTPAPNTVHFR